MRRSRLRRRGATLVPRPEGAAPRCRYHPAGLAIWRATAWWWRRTSGWWMTPANPSCAPGSKPVACCCSTIRPVPATRRTASVRWSRRVGRPWPGCGAPHAVSREAMAGQLMLGRTDQGIADELAYRLRRRSAPCASHGAGRPRTARRRSHRHLPRRSPERRSGDHRAPRRSRAGGLLRHRFAFKTASIATCWPGPAPGSACNRWPRRRRRWW